MRKATIFFLILSLGLSLITPAYAKQPTRKRSQPGFSAKSALVWNVTENKVYFEKNSQMRVYPASTTKVMTALLALEKLSLDDYVVVSRRATRVPQTSLGFREGEQYKVSDLIYACLLKSANDAAGVLAEAVAGSQEKFVEMMNQRAKEAGATNTRFSNAHGLPGGTQYTTAKDMAFIFKEALKKPFFKQAISYRYRIIYSKTGRRHFLKTHNKALFLNWKKDIYGKTGYTIKAQSCFVGYIKKGNDVYIVDVFGCRKRWDDIKWMIEKFVKIDL